ncbi:hypothetical protein ON010_g7654 [Phytophthora cinnamomi]|nr:hypothetical protein ON010_g7654 [Phytophthora cinnamomi]
MQAPTQSIADNAESPGDVRTLSSIISSRPRGQVRHEKTTCCFRGFKYTRAWASSRKISYRWRQGCRGTMAFFIGTMGYTAGRPHTCRQVDAAGSSLVDVTGLMKDRADMLAIDQVALPAHVFGKTSATRFTMRIMSMWCVGCLIPKCFGVFIKQEAGTSVEMYMERLNSTTFIGVERSCLILSVSLCHDERENLSKPTRSIGWAHPSLINLLRYSGTTIFVDGTFRCVLSGYKQCVDFMVHDRASGLFVPVYYVSSTSRSGDSYSEMVHVVVQGTDQQLEPAEVVCDFESALIEAIPTQFPNAIVLGCLFHLKQALRRAMKKFLIPEEECCIAMTRGVVDMLTVVEHCLIEQAIKWVKRQIRQRCGEAGISYSKAKWRGFWGYFQRIWLEYYDVSVWNVASLNNELIAQTNNPL